MDFAAAGDSERPYAIVQYSLAGWGAYEQGGRTWRINPGDCFTAIIPSAHRYYLPEQSPIWTFCFLIIPHDYAVRRLMAMQRQFGPVLKLAADSPPVVRLLSILQWLYTAGFRDDLAVEQSLLDFALEFERQARQSFFPPRAGSCLTRSDVACWPGWTAPSPSMSWPPKQAWVAAITATTFAPPPASLRQNT